MDVIAWVGETLVWTSSPLRMALLLRPTRWGGAVSPARLLFFAAGSKFLPASINSASNRFFRRRRFFIGPIGKAIVERMRAGSLVSDELVNQLVFERIHQPDCERGFILDGYPRTPAQAEEMMRLLAAAEAREVVIHLVVDYNIIISRITGRRVCPKCGTLYNAISRPPKTEGVCDLDGTKLVVRDDDREEVVRERLAQYERQTQPLIEFFRATSDRMIEVDASQDGPEVVFQRIQAQLKDLVRQ